MHGQMAETTKEEVDGGNEVNDPSEWDDDATKGLKNSGEQMESPVKEKSLGVLKSFRRSLKGFSPKTQKDKRSENTDDQTSNSPLRSPHSPSLSRGSPSQPQTPKTEKNSLTRTMSGDRCLHVTRLTSR